MCVEWVRMAQGRVHTVIFCEYSMFSIESGKLCAQNEICTKESTAQCDTYCVYLYICKKEMHKDEEWKYIDRIKWVSSIENFQKQPTVDNIPKYTAVWRGVYGSRSTGRFLYQLTAKTNTLGPATQASAHFYSSVCILGVHHLTEENIQTHFVTSLQIQSLKRIHRLFQHRNTTHTAGS